MVNRPETLDKHPPPPRARCRSKRVQKKLRIGKFTEYGFAIGFRLAESLSTKERDDFWSVFIGELIEKRGLAYGGGEEAYITKFSRGSVTEEDRGAVSKWLNERAGVEHVVVGHLENTRYGHTENEQCGETDLATPFGPLA